MKTTVKQKKKVETGYWEVNPEMLEKTLKVLGIEWEVSIRRTSHSRRFGRHLIKMQPNGSWKHYITVDKDRNIYLSTRTLLHELRHAWQAEQFAKKNQGLSKYEFIVRYNSRPESQGKYWDRPIEVDARKAEERVLEFPFLLVKEYK